MLLLQQMLVLFAYIVIGFLCGKTGMVKTEYTNPISWFVVNVANPALMLAAAIGAEKGIPVNKLLQAAVMAAAVYTVMLVLAQLLPGLLRVPGEERGLYKLMIVFNNIGFMGFPIVSAAFGKEALLYAAIFSVFFDILFYTYGIMILRGKEKGVRRNHFSALLNVGTISALLSVVLYLGEIPVPSFLCTAVDGLGNATGPLSMYVIGVSLSSICLRELIGDMKVLLFTGVKLLVIPVVGVGIAKIFLTDRLLLNVCMIMLATPVASMAVMLAQQYQKNVELASKTVALTTVLSVVTIPVVSVLVL